MAIYAIGDIQGCYDDLLRLLEHIKFDDQVDQLWFAGDLVNRGPKSLETLRFVKSLHNAAITVLGNHDLHLIATSFEQRKPRKKDTLSPVLQADDSDELLYWLRHQPLFHYNDDFCLLHAGLPPQWDFATTKKMALTAEAVLQGDKHLKFFRVMYGNKPHKWTAYIKGMDKIRFIVNCFTRMRYCKSNGYLDFKHNNAPGTQPSHLMPWFTVPKRKSSKMKIIFGHWSTLGYYQGHNCFAIDTGCLWGGQLTAIKLGEKVQRISIDCEGI
ncbi:MAG: symmetrical bis(5'-nucleosyl)-tetraphosphatase [Methylococcales symbiont of Iophon sp. n. MRB-2018]|nr:MAG: symmetrical bis(5'-nucleosyl)-tetraphosphatase [Methylococcales symbiont of Iophon sp. n. MRB-2018]KAF3979167.1 MAG: symmetrical bis(5'-nucleosyl)-tetraphosphatase [Methylococcales symbiont of Iophon sp. n. MRB-2018]